MPAGTLLRCTLDEPELSSKTAEIGGPVICQLTGVLRFGQTVVPRGSYLGGHLESDKEPGHSFGKGYLRLEFDHIGLPDGEIPVRAKIIAAKGYRVNWEGDILGNPTLKREEALTLRLMDDVPTPTVAESQGRSQALAQPFYRRAA